VRRRAGETGDLARLVTSTAERGEALVNDSVQGMYRVEESIRRASEIVEALGHRSQEIGRIVDVIQEVADQTNLLSLNAAIIAAQAGEQGLAFGVVAEEIRSLAERTARSTREIAAIVRQTRGQVDAAVTHVQEGRERATAGVALGDRAASSLKEIRATTQRTFAAVEATVAETVRLEAQGGHVVQASTRVANRIVELTRASVEQAEAGRQLVRQTQEMALVVAVQLRPWRNRAWGLGPLSLPGNRTVQRPVDLEGAVVVLEAVEVTLQSVGKRLVGQEVAVELKRPHIGDYRSGNRKPLG